MKLKKIIESIDQKVELNEKAAFLQEVSLFNEYGKVIYRTEGMREAAEKISKIVENAERIALQETDEWFDEVTVKRNMKSLHSNNESFKKTVGEIAKLQQRLEALYEEMGGTLGRYYEIR
jgi:predicted nuclease with TOPRIM domain